ncbi:MAG: hypothetical protein OXG37_10010 [Actinomycetia bacterium]|nr:hypothetical protein [Actinomycetes bacterium]
MLLDGTGGVEEFLSSWPARAGRVGEVFVAGKEDSSEFSPMDEETLVLFVSQAVLVVGNARRHRGGRKARAGLETLIDTSPVGVVVFGVSRRPGSAFRRRGV